MNGQYSGRDANTSNGPHATTGLCVFFGPMSLRSRLHAVGPGGGTATVLTLAAFAESLALGVFLTAGPLYFIRVVGLSPAQTGAVITMAGLIGLLVGLPAGGLADRWGTRWVVLPPMALQAIGLGCYVLVR